MWRRAGVALAEGSSREAEVLCWGARGGAALCGFSGLALRLVQVLGEGS